MLPYLQGRFDKVNNNKVEQLKIDDFKLCKGKYYFNGSKYFNLNKVTANFLPPRIFNSKLLQYPKAKVI